MGQQPAQHLPRSTGTAQAVGRQQGVDRIGMGRQNSHGNSASKKKSKTSDKLSQLCCITIYRNQVAL
jgi:hypothetical protein